MLKLTFYYFNARKLCINWFFIDKLCLCRNADIEKSRLTDEPISDTTGDPVGGLMTELDKARLLEDPSVSLFTK